MIYCILYALMGNKIVTVKLPQHRFCKDRIILYTDEPVTSEGILRQGFNTRNKNLIFNAVVHQENKIQTVFLMPCSICRWLVVASCFFCFAMGCEQHHTAITAPLNLDSEKRAIAIQSRLSAPIIVQLQSRPAAIVTKAKHPIIEKDMSGTGNPFFTNYGTTQGLPVNNIICSAG